LSEREREREREREKGERERGRERKKKRKREGGERVHESTNMTEVWDRTSVMG
jgi:hypothetical protein